MSLSTAAASPLLPIPPKTSKNVCYCSAMGIVKSLVTSANL